MTDEKYSIRIGRETIDGISTGELKALHEFIKDFLAKENGTSLVSDQERSGMDGAWEESSPEHPLICKDSIFDSDTREFETEFGIYTGNDSLTDLSGRELIELYFTLRAFLTRSEHLPEGVPPRLQFSGEKKEKAILIASCQPEAFKGFEGDCVSICKRTQLNGQQGALQNDYTLSTPRGSAFGLSRKEFLTLYEQIGNFLYPA